MISLAVGSLDFDALPVHCSDIAQGSRDGRLIDVPIHRRRGRMRNGHMFCGRRSITCALATAVDSHSR